MKRIGAAIMVLGVVVGLNLGLSSAQSSAKPKSLKVVLVTFFSGSGSVSGVPEANFAKLAIDQINSSGGIGGVPVVAQYVDESGGPNKNATQMRQLASQHFDAVLGYVSSADCLTVAPVAEEAHQLTILAGCNTVKLFAGRHYRYIYRVIPPASSDNLAGALYLLKAYPAVKTIAGIDPDYAYGRDAWKYFMLAVQRFRPDVKAVGALWPQLFAGAYTSEISRLLALHPDVVYSSLWGGDLTAFIQQGLAQGLFQQSKVVLADATEAGLKGEQALPDGVIGGSENTYLFHPGPIRQPAVRQLVSRYRAMFHEYPINMYAYPTVTSVLALKAAYARALARTGPAWPTMAQVADALAGVRVDTALGPLDIRADHDASFQDQWGTSVHTTQYPFAVFNNIIHFPAAEITPPLGTNPDAWITSLPPDTLTKVAKPIVYSVTR